MTEGDDAEHDDPGGVHGDDAGGEATAADHTETDRTETANGAAGPFADWLPGLEGRYPVVFAVATITVVALLARLVLLGVRPAHFDEARVAYWALYAHEQGSFAYRHIIHGPFVQHTSRWLFALFGASDLVMRAPVAIVGGLLPLSALLFRGHLRDDETVALALFLAFNTVLLYYSRFMRSDVLVGGFMLVALGFLVRFLDHRKPRYLYGVALFAAFGISSKENAVLYVVTWAGAAALLLDRLLDSPGSDRTAADRIRTAIWTARAKVRAEGNPGSRAWMVRYGLHVAGALVLFALVWLFMFAPRGDGLGGMQTNPNAADVTVGLGEALFDPGLWPALVEATYDRFATEYLAWGGSTGDLTFEAYQNRLLDMVTDGLWRSSAPLIALAVVGFVRERYGRAEGRNLVYLLAFAGAASIVGYPLGLSIGGGWKWNIVHILLPLSIPAAVGAAMLYRWGRDAYRDDDLVDVGLTAFLILLVVGIVAMNGLTMVYQNPQHKSNSLVQFAQPIDNLDPVVEELEAAAPSEGTDVVVYSDPSTDVPLVTDPGNNNYWNVTPTCTDLGNFLPMHWYLSSTGTNSTCAREPAELRWYVENEDVPVVITKTRDESVPTEFLRERYTHAGNYSLRYIENANPTIAVYVRDGE